MSDPKDKNDSRKNQISHPVEGKKGKIKGKNDQCRKEKDIESCFALEHKENNPCRAEKI